MSNDITGLDQFMDYTVEIDKNRDISSIEQKITTYQNGKEYRNTSTATDSESIQAKLDNMENITLDSEYTPKAKAYINAAITYKKQTGESIIQTQADDNNDIISNIQIGTTDIGAISQDKRIAGAMAAGDLILHTIKSHEGNPESTYIDLDIIKRK